MGEEGKKRKITIEYSDLIGVMVDYEHLDLVQATALLQIGIAVLQQKAMQAAQVNANITRRTQ